jgi:hypothetical protein
VVNLVDLHRQPVLDIVTHEFEPGVPEKVGNVEPRSGEEVVETDDFVTVLDEPVAQV